MPNFFRKICNWPLILTGQVMAPDQKLLKLTVMYHYFFLNVTFNNLFVLNTWNVANRYIFKCKRAAKGENGGENMVFKNEFGPFLVFIPCWTEKIWKFQLITSKFSAFQALKVTGIKSNGRYIFQLLSW